MTLDPIQVMPEEVMWTYLSHEHKWKGIHAGIAQRFKLGATKFPRDLNDTSDQMIKAVESEVSVGRCDQAVLSTLSIFGELKWQLHSITAITAKQLGSVYAQLPGEYPSEGHYIPGLQRPVSKLLLGWLTYLNLDNEKSRQDAEAHRHMLKELSTGELSHKIILRDERGDKTVVGDGKHRLFAAYQHALNNPGFQLEVYWGH